MKLLVSESRAHLDGIGWSERNVMMLYQQFEAAFRMRLSQDAQRFLAMPEPVGTDRIDYYTDDHAQALRYTDLPDTDRPRTDSRIEAIVSEIERFRQELSTSDDSNNRNIATALERTFLVPGKTSIWLVDGAPVITNWGFQSDGTALDVRSIKGPKTHARAAAPVPAWRRAVLPGLLALLLLAGLLAWLFGEHLLCAAGMADCTGPVAVADDATLPAGADFVDIDVTANDTASDGDPITLTTCTAPGFVRDGRSARLTRAEATGATTRFDCTVTDPSGNTDTAPVTVTLQPAQAAPNPVAALPEVQTVSVFLPVGAPEIGIDALSGLVNPAPSDRWRLTECDAPGDLTGPSLTYRRPPDESITQESFACTATNADGATLSIPVEVSIGQEAARCQPFTRNLPVRLLIGADWSFSMDQDDRFAKVLGALTEIRRNLPPETDATVELMTGSRIIDLRSQGEAFLADPTSRGRANPNFAAYMNWLKQEIDKAGEDYALITVVTITDAQDDAAGILPTFRAAFEGAQAPIEHTMITLTSPKNETLRAQYRQLVWPQDETRNYRELLDQAAQAALPSEILQAARMTVREGCETP